MGHGHAPQKMQTAVIKGLVDRATGEQFGPGGGPPSGPYRVDSSKAKFRGPPVCSGVGGLSIGGGGSIEPPG